VKSPFNETERSGGSKNGDSLVNTSAAMKPPTVELPRIQ
jgi:hypothetical protein